jgi:hypothetical protein
MNSSGKASSKHRFVPFLIIGMVGIGVLSVLLFNIRSGQLPDEITWLTPAEFAQIKRVGTLTRLKYQVMRWTAPLWNSYWRNQPQITITARVVTLPVEMLWLTNSFPPVVTNGTRSWILSPEQRKSIQTELDALPETAVAHRSQAIVAEGVSAQVSTVNTVGSGTNTATYGSAVALSPDVVNGKVMLIFELNHSQLATDPAPGELTVKPTKPAPVAPYS